MNKDHNNPSIDINADAGEANTPDQWHAEQELFNHITSVNIACGGHTGDQRTMQRTVQRAAHAGLAIGAHPAYPDPQNFGRIPMNMPEHELRAAILQQLNTLRDIAAAQGVQITHCKPHGALYHQASTNPDAANAIRHACAEALPHAALIAQAQSTAAHNWQAAGARVLEEAFADRTYQPHGTLTPRAHPSALIQDPAAAAKQAVNIATARPITHTDGRQLHLTAHTICIHSDTPNAPAIAAAVRAALITAGVNVRPHT